MFPLPVSIPTLYTTVIGVGATAILLVYLENKRKIKINHVGLQFAMLSIILYFLFRYGLPSISFFF